MLTTNYSLVISQQIKRWALVRMNANEMLTIYLATLGIVGGLAGYVITHLLGEIKRLNQRVDEIYNILLER